jgi:hypothetical protein
MAHFSPNRCPPPPRSAKASLIAAQKTARLAHSHPRLRGNMRQKQVLHSGHMQLFCGSRGVQPYRESVLQIKHPFVLSPRMFVLFYPHYSAAIINFPEIWRKKKHAILHLTLALSNFLSSTLQTWRLWKRFLPEKCAEHFVVPIVGGCDVRNLLLMFPFRKWKVKTLETAWNILPRWLLCQGYNCLTWEPCVRSLCRLCVLWASQPRWMDACTRIPWR